MDAGGGVERELGDKVGVECGLAQITRQGDVLAVVELKACQERRSPGPGVERLGCHKRRGQYDGRSTGGTAHVLIGLLRGRIRRSLYRWGETEPACRVAASR